MRAGLAALVVALSLAGSAHAACENLAWPLETERALLNGTVDAFASGETRKTMPSRALSLMLDPGSKADLPVAPGRPLDPSRFAGYVSFPVVKTGDYLISLSSEGWIDAVQNGSTIASTAHTGDPACPGLRKSLRFALAQGLVTLEISNAPADHIEIAITPAP
jgi:hypothetical protein